MRRTIDLSDQAINEELLRVCDLLVDQLRRTTHTGVELAFAMTWVGSEVTDDRGVPINDRVFLQLPNNREAWDDLLSQLVSKTQAFALLLIDRHVEGLKVLYESPMGTRTWRLKKERHGDLEVLSRPVVTDNVETTGLLWSTSDRPAS